ncbi:MAG: hypothetical protein HKN32_07270 [Flavobacteriales bacterium]|nr:hypothetical protein [Flavobacteriales bacterium]
MSTWDKTLQFYDDLVARSSNFERKGKTVPYTSANGYMFSLMNKDGEFGIRLSKDRAKAFMEEHDTTIFKSHGAVMRDYVLIPESMFEDSDFLLKTLEAGYAHVMSLPPK